MNTTPLSRLVIRPFLLLALLYFVATPVLHAQVIAMQDKFTYTSSNINGHAPTTGTGVWSTYYGTGSNISSTGTQAVMLVNSGTIGASTAVANYSFTPAPNTLYTIQVTLNYTGPIGSGHDCWAGVGFSNSTGGGNNGSNNGPWMLIRPQATSTDTPGTGGFHGSVSNGSGNVPAADFANPIVATVTWNTSTGQAQYFIDGIIQSSWTVTTTLPSGAYYALVQGFQTGSAVNIGNVTLTAQSLQLASMQDNFTYVTSNINGHAPTSAPAGLGAWSIWSSSGGISTDGTQAVVLTGTGTPGTGQVISSYAFLPSANMLYSVRATLNFRGPIGAGYDCWAGLGFSTAGTNLAPTILIRPQGLPTDTPQFNGFNDGGSVGSTNVPAADYSAPITVTITWNTSTGLAQYYVDNILQSATWTASHYVPTGLCNAFFQGFQTGNAVNVSNITLTAQPLPLPTVIFVPNDPNVGGIPVDFMAEFTTGSSQWTTAQSHSTLFQVGSNFVEYQPAANLQTVVSYALAHNLLVGVDIGGLIPTSGTCGGGEGYTSLAFAASVAGKLKTAGCTKLYIQLDEPLTFGYEHFGITWSCNISMAACASDCQQVIQQFTNAFGTGNVFVGDAEPLGSVPQADIVSWMAAYKLAVGTSLQYIDNDMDFRVAMNPTITNMATAIAGGGVTFGEIYGGGGNFASVSGTQWVLAAEENIQIYNATANIPNYPQHLSIASWGPYPTNVLPETANSTLSYLADYYFTSPYAAEPPPVGLTFLNKNNSNFFTTSGTEVTAFVTAGWNDLGIRASVEPALACAPGLVPFYRYHNATSGYYAYASTSAEQSTLVSQGYTYQEIACYVFPLSTGGNQGGVPLYKFVNSSTTNYYYSTNPSDYPSGWTTPPTIECYVACNYLPGSY
jgi:hypothetical protein